MTKIQSGPVFTDRLLNVFWSLWWTFTLITWVEEYVKTGYVVTITWKRRLFQNLFEKKYSLEPILYVSRWSETFEIIRSSDFITFETEDGKLVLQIMMINRVGKHNKFIGAFFRRTKRNQNEFVKRGKTTKKKTRKTIDFFVSSWHPKLKECLFVNLSYLEISF